MPTHGPRVRTPETFSPTRPGP
ncbi:hypothetical protein MICRO116_720023 [Micrococcus sp. 116]|nr:hypothetical protein MICRO116_720023 [Micrococcus sp. 116]